MKITILSLSFTAIAFFSGNTHLLAQKKAKDKILGGKVFVVEMTETTNKKVGKMSTEELSFKSEKLNSKTMTTENHFPAAFYTVSVDSSSTPWVITFTSDGKNPDGEEVKFEGTVTGDEIDGVATITKKGKIKREYAYTGTLKVKGAKKKE